MKRFRWMAVPVVLAFYAVLYIATTRVETYPEVVCEGVCEKVRLLDSSLRLSYPQIYANVRNTDNVCVVIGDTTTYNWQNIADSSCSFLTSQGLQNYNVSIIRSFNGIDTLLKQRCP